MAECGRVVKRETYDTKKTIPVLPLINHMALNYLPLLLWWKVSPLEDVNSNFALKALNNC